MTHAITFHDYGGPEVLRYEEVALGMPAGRGVLVRQHAIGVNYIDIYHRTGLYPVSDFPAVPGYEAAGVVEAIGDQVQDFQIGDRVAYGLSAMGAYTEARVLPEERLIKLPDDISFEVAAASMLKGLTAHYLLRRTFPVQEGMTVLVHAAAGGVGLLLCQWAKFLGATVIGTVSSAKKAALATENGCDYPIIYTKEDVAESVRAITEGEGVNVVYDGVGKDTFMASLDSLTRFGLFVSYGQSSGAIPPFDAQLLSQKGSLFMTRPTLMHYKEDEAEYKAGAIELTEMIRRGFLNIRIDQTFPLAEAAMAHAKLESRATTGALVLTA